MRILLDESVPRGLAPSLLGHEVSTARAEGWNRLRNGILLRAAVDAGFRVVITCDSSIPFQQNLMRIGIAVIVLVGVRNRLETLRPLLPAILDALDRIRPGDAVEISPAPRRDQVFDRPVLSV